MTEKKALHVYLDQSTLNTWTGFADVNGVSLTSVIEALGRDLAQELAKADANGGDATDIHQDVIRAARRIDATRRSRRSRTIRASAT